MTGDDQVRHCSLCRLNVYNISEMSRENAEAFLRQATGRTCIRYYERSDGKIMTKDCPKGMAAARRKLALALTAFFALGCMLPQFAKLKPIPKEKIEQAKTDVRNFPPVKAMLDKIDPPPPPPVHTFAGAMVFTPGPTSPMGKP